MSTPIRIGVIGCGQIAQHHFKEYAKLPAGDMKVVAAADINEACARDTAAKYQVEHVYTDFRKMLARDDIDAVDVCLHNNFHRPVTEAAPGPARYTTAAAISSGIGSPPVGVRSMTSSVKAG